MNSGKRLWYLSVISTALLLWAFHFWYLSQLFENVRFFSHLSDFEREMTYRTEMGLYFAFYKTLIFSPTFTDGIHRLLQDNVTEFGHTINALQRFNLYPEITLSAAFRLFKSLAKYFNFKDQVCWQVNRGSELPPVNSCEGLGNYHYFYVYAAFFVAGSVLASLFIGGIFIGHSYLGGVLAIAAFMSNHGEATRVQWTPPLRETFAYPAFLAQMLTLGYALRRHELNVSISIALIMLTTTFCAFWQLSQFVIGTQLGSLALLFSLEWISPSKMFSLWKLFSLSFCLSVAILFGNSVLLNSLYLSSLLSILGLLLLRDLLQRVQFRPLFLLLHLFFHLASTLAIKMFFQRIFGLNDDNNVVDLLKSKLLTNFATFHTRLYTCAAEFDFLPFETISKLAATWLLPATGVALLLWLKSSIAQEMNRGLLWRTSIQKRTTTPCPELAYHFTQLGCFLMMALFVMRLKLFATPHLCLLCSLLANKQIWEQNIGRHPNILRHLLVGSLLAGMLYKGWPNMREQLELRGEFNNPEQEQLFTWIQQNTAPDSVFAGTMALMANLKLSTLRPIVNHPHYESEEIRNRTLQVYSMYSRKTVEEVHSRLRSMRIDFYVFQPQQCLQTHPRPECTYLAMWDLEDPKNREQPSLCHSIWQAIRSADHSQLLALFRPVYNSPSYVILALH